MLCLYTAKNKNSYTRLNNIRTNSNIDGYKGKSIWVSSLICGDCVGFSIISHDFGFKKLAGHI